MMTNCSILNKWLNRSIYGDSSNCNMITNLLYFVGHNFVIWKDKTEKTDKA